MSNRRILSLWFPRLGAERLLRAEPHLGEHPFVVVRETGQMQVVSSLSQKASEAGLYVGQPLRDAHAMSATLLTRFQNPRAEAMFLGILHRWAGKFSPWVAREDPDALVIDLTGCAHLFGGEAGLLAQLAEDCSDLGLTIRAGIADTLGAAWALARFAGQTPQGARSGDAIDQEAPATRAKAGKRRHWERGGGLVPAPTRHLPVDSIAPPGQTHGALAGLPVAALRIDGDVVAHLTRLGLRRIGDLTGQPRAALARRFGTGLVQRLDQALGSAPEPVSPSAPPERFSIRITFPDPIGLEEDVSAGIDRLLPPLMARLETRGRGARAVRLEVWRSDGTMQWETVTLARPAASPDRLRPLLRMKLPDIDAGFGIDMLRLEVVRHEPLSVRTRAGHLEAANQGRARLQDQGALDDLLGRLGARVGMEEITRRHPGDSHLPEKSAQVQPAAWSEPAPNWPKPAVPRPLLLWRPEPVTASETPVPPKRFRWRGRDFDLTHAEGPERILPEWWLDDPDWRSGARDYWRVTTGQGDRLWLYFAHGAALSPGWFCHGAFA